MRPAHAFEGETPATIVIHNGAPPGYEASSASEGLCPAGA
jgi:hypothetical protein